MRGRGAVGQSRADGGGPTGEEGGRRGATLEELRVGSSGEEGSHGEEGVRERPTESWWRGATRGGAQPAAGLVEDAAARGWPGRAGRRPEK